MRVYTVGAQRSYDKALAEAEKTGVPVTKIGKSDTPEPEYPEGYPGGWVWATSRGALKMAVEMTEQQGFLFAVYEVELAGSWEESVYMGPDGEFHLIADATVTRRVDPV